MQIDHPRGGVHYPRSLGEFQSWFATDADCLDYLEWLRWPVARRRELSGEARAESLRKRGRGLAVAIDRIQTNVAT